MMMLAAVPEDRLAASPVARGIVASADGWVTTASWGARGADARSNGSLLGIAVLVAVIHPGIWPPVQSTICALQSPCRPPYMSASRDSDFAHEIAPIIAPAVVVSPGSLHPGGHGRCGQFGGRDGPGAAGSNVPWGG